jgi:hypothetical protein
VLNVCHAENGADPVCSRGGDGNAASTTAGGFLHPLKFAQRAAVQNALLREQDVLR